MGFVKERRASRVPHLGAGLRASMLLSQAPLAESNGDGAPGVLVLDHRGRVVEHTQAAKRYLEDLGDLGPGWQEDEDLPVAVWMVVGALRRALAARCHEVDLWCIM